MIPYEGESTIRPYYDAPDVEVPIRWYLANPNAADIPRTIFGSPVFSQHGFRPVLGTTRKYNRTFVGNAGAWKGIKPCGGPDDWMNGVSLFNPEKPCDCEACVCKAMQEVPTGTVDDVNKVFTLSQMPVNSASVQFYVDGIIQVQGVDYTISSQTITTSSASVPRIGNTVYAWYVTEIT